MSDLSQAKEVTVSDISGARMTIPPGVRYRGVVMTKNEYLERRRRDLSTEVIGPYFDQVGQELEQILDVGAGT